MSFREKIINLVYRVATGSRKLRLFITPVAAASYFTFVLLFVIASLLVDQLFGLSLYLSSPLNMILSIPLILIGLGLVFWCLFHFFRVKGTPVPFNPPPKLVKRGPYAHMRNPMITGLFIFLFGLGTLLNSPSLTLIFTPLFILINVLELKTIEEPELEKRLGKDYLEYKKKTPMFFPKIWRKN